MLAAIAGSNDFPLAAEVQDASRPYSDWAFSVAALSREVFPIPRTP